MNQRTIKFRARKSEKDGTMGRFVYGYYFVTHERPNRSENWIIEQDFPQAQHLIYPETIGQFTGLLDKKGKEIYELMEIDNKYRVVYKAPKYVLQDISTGDIIDVYDKSTITGEYSPIS